jgi:hypothetical protein
MLIKTFCLPTELIDDFAVIVDAASGVTSWLRLNTYNTIVCDHSTVSDAIKQYFHLKEVFRVTVETVKAEVLPMHTDVHNGIGQQPRLSHVIVNPCSKHITIKTRTEHFDLAANHWFLLNSTLLHGAVCTPPHSVVCLDARLDYDQYAALLNVV